MGVAGAAGRGAFSGDAGIGAAGAGVEACMGVADAVQGHTQAARAKAQREQGFKHG